MPSNEYLEAFLEKAKELLPKWLWKKIYQEALPVSGGRVKNNISKEEIILKPEPKEDESREEFIDRFMSNEEAIEDFPNEEQRLAIAINYWQEELEGNPLSKDKSECEEDKKDKKVAKQEVENTPTIDWQREGKIISKEDEQQLVYGVVLEPEQVDSQDDIISAQEIEKTAHSYLKNSRIVGKSHIEKADASVVESYLAPTDFELNNEVVLKGSWVLVTKIEDADLWQEVKKGEYNAFSIGGYGQRE